MFDASSNLTWLEFPPFITRKTVHTDLPPENQQNIQNRHNNIKEIIQTQNHYKSTGSLASTVLPRHIAPASPPRAMQRKGFVIERGLEIKNNNKKKKQHFGAPLKSFLFPGSVFGQSRG